MSYSSATVGTPGRGANSTQNVSQTVPSGALVVVAFAYWESFGSGGVTFPATLTDNFGNTFTRRAQATNGTISTGHYEGVVPSGGSWSLTLSVTGGSSTRQWDAVPIYWTGNPASAEFDVSVTNTGTSGTLNTGTLPTTAATAELAVGTFTSTAGGTSIWSGTDTPNGAVAVYSQGDNNTLQSNRVVTSRQGDGSGPINLHSNGSFAETTTGTSGNYVAGIASYLVGAAVSVGPPPMRRRVMRWFRQGW